MDNERPLFIISGNGPYDNLGCEAIVRGTTKILRKFFNDPRFICVTHFKIEDQFTNQSIRETDPAITHLSSHRINRRRIFQNFWKLESLKSLYGYYLDDKAYYASVYADMIPYLNNASAVLSAGGDNYQIGYGIPKILTACDDIILDQGKPLIIWGASIGPFDAMPDYERYMSEHLNKVTGIFARESVTIDYLKGIGVEQNVLPVADPAFLMDPIKPKENKDDFFIEKEAIGINLSPLMAKFIFNGDLKEWTQIAASIITGVAQKTEMPIYLIPHVIHPTSNNDYNFMQKALDQTSKSIKNITLVAPEYNAAEMKWIIGQMAFFMGARTHSTIASISSGVPTLSLAYSIKAIGINQDVFGHTNYCMESKDLNAKVITDRILSMLNESSAIKRDILDQIPRVQNASMSAGIGLKQLIGDN